MKICAVICEFNPLQNGHKMISEKARELTSCDFVLCIMSGNFTQRGEYAIVDKFTRANFAILAGADMVVHNPTVYSCSSSEIFALSNIKIANSFKNITHLCFGSECGDIEILKKCANFLCNEPKEYSELLKKYLELGNNYNKSRALALVELAQINEEFKSYLEILNSPNNILAVEYIKALSKTNSKIEPVTIKRIGSFNSNDLSDFASSTAIRNELYKTNKLTKCKNSMPENVYTAFEEYLKNNNLPSSQVFDNMMLYALRTKSLLEMQKTFDVIEGLENRIKEVAKNSLTSKDYFEKIATKRYQPARLRRIATHLVLGITKDDVMSIYNFDKLPYIKVLAAKKSILKDKLICNTNLIVRNGETKNLPDEAKRLIEIEENSEQLYALLTNKVNTTPYILQTCKIYD